MQLPVFDQAYLLTALGWAIANSIWQTGILWLLYRLLLTFDKKIPALVKYHLSIVLLLVSFSWFLLTIFQYYRQISGTAAFPGLIVYGEGILGLQFFNNILPAISLVYLFIVCLYSVKFLKHLSVNSFLQTEGLTKAPVDIRLFVSNTALHLGIKKKIKVWLSAHVDVPSVTGFIKPVILLPVAFINHLSPCQTEAVLLHELTHIKRNDFLVNIIQSVIELILFFNPFIKLLSKSARNERENCCDDWVLNFRYDRYDYGNALLVLEEKRQFVQSGLELAASNGKKNLLQRVKRLFVVLPQTTFSSMQKMKLAMVYLFLFAAMFFLLPSIQTKQLTENITRGKNIRAKLHEKPGSHLKEIPSKNIIAGKTIVPLNVEKQVVTKRKPKNQPKNEPEGEYVNTFINEELIYSNIPVEPNISYIVDKEVSNSKYLVIVEEQQSGNKQTNTYYLELNTKEGNTVIKPLIILNKFKVTQRKKAVKSNPDSLNSPARPAKKMRITS